MQKPGDHPEFFRLAAPAGASRESTIRLDREGRFWHDGARFEHAALEAAMHGWIARHPDDGRYVLTNGWDWTYFEVEDVPYFVRASRVDGDVVTLALSDGTEEQLDPAGLRSGGQGALYARVKGGAFEARFDRHAQMALAPLVVEGDDGEPRLSVSGRSYVIK